MWLRVLPAAQRPIRSAQLIVSLTSLRIQFQPTEQWFLRGSKVALPREARAESEMSSSQFVIQLNGFFKARLSLLPLVEIGVGRTQQQVGIGVGTMELNGFEEMRNTAFRFLSFQEQALALLKFLTGLAGDRKLLSGDGRFSARWHCRWGFSRKWLQSEHNICGRPGRQVHPLGCVLIASVMHFHEIDSGT